jgi:single-strand DNA-binding protein
MADTITVAGLVATPIKHTTTSEGLEISTFRLASSTRRFDSKTQAWVDGDTNWFTITAFRHLAANVHASLDKGHRVVVAGKLRVREWRDGEKLGRDVEIIADALGPDLAWGRAQYTRTPRKGAETGQLETVEDAGASHAVAADAADASGFPAEAQLAAATPF